MHIKPESQSNESAPSVTGKESSLSGTSAPSVAGRGQFQPLTEVQLRSIIRELQAAKAAISRAEDAIDQSLYGWNVY